MKTNFEKVIEFNKCFGSYVSSTLNPELFKTNPKIVELKFSLVEEEVNELVDAYNNNNKIEIIDALSDIKYVVYGMAAAFGIHMDNEFRNYLETYGPKPLLQGGSNFEMIHNHYKNSLTPLRTIITVIKSCLENTKVNIKCSDITNLKINLCKILYNVNKFGCYININLDKSFDIVHQSNMTKVCYSEELAKQTVQWYLDNDKRYNTPCYRQNDYGWIIFNKDSGKILKSIHYIPADFSELL
tara:strand:- start:178 stop:903 length:726 start_codon:yes stop_codon:yes gene_type:complete